MLDFRPILFINGLLLTTLAVAMVLPALVDAATGHPDWQVFLTAAGLTLFIGVSLILTTRGSDMALGLREAFLLTTSAWVLLALFGSLPFVFAEMNLDYVDAFFEAMSGITTTGSTIIIGLDDAPPGILLWRSLLQWLGGIGIIVTAVAVLPMLRIGGMQIFRLDFAEGVEKTMPRVAQISIGIVTTYLLLTFVCALLFWSFGMSGFDAFAHAMTTIATGGYSTHDRSLGFFDSPAIEWTTTVFMFLSSLPFILFVQMMNGHWTAVYRDRQVRGFFFIVVTAVLILAAALIFTLGFGYHEALRAAAFNAVSVITGTGYATTDYDNWGAFAFSTFFILTFIGGCAGSTTCGIKVFRFQVLYAIAGTQLRRLISPHTVSVPYYNNRPITEDISLSVLSFFFFYVLVFVSLAAALGFLGLDFVTAMSAAATAISNVGPGLGAEIGPAGTFANLPDAAKWLLSAGMLLGRLELFTVLILFSPNFWRN